MKTGIFLSTRNKSSRLPGKVLLELKDKTVTDHIIERLKKVTKAWQIVLCTSTNPNDDPLVMIAKNNNIEYFRGSEEDKLDRYLAAARKYHIDFIVVVDGDDIFCDPLFIDVCIAKFEESKGSIDYLTIKDAPIGAVPFCIKTSALEKVCALKNEIDTEIWGSCFTDSGLFNTLLLEVPNPKLRRPDIRLTLDYKEDFILIEKIFVNLWKEGQIFSLEEVIELLTRHPEMLNINRHARDLFLQNQLRTPKVTLRPE